MSFSSAAALKVTGSYPTTAGIMLIGTPGGTIGSPYTLTATVTGTASASLLSGPTGTVSFLDTTTNNSVLASALLGSSTPGLSFNNVSNPAIAQPFVVVSADFNGDGIPDLAVSATNYPLASLIILLGQGDGTFIAAPNIPTGGPYTGSIAVGDFNGDGIPDLAVSSTTFSVVTILLGKGDGTFVTAPNLNTAAAPNS